MQERTVTFTHPCAHSSVVLEAFGKEIGETIKIGGSVDKDYFLVRFDEMPVEDAQAAIAKTLNAKWEEKDGTLYLTRTRAQELLEEKALREGSLGIIRKAQSEARERLKDDASYTLSDLLTKFEGSENPQSKLRGDKPIARMADRLLSIVSAEDLYELPKGMTTFALDPRPDDRQIPQSWRPIMEQYIDEKDVWDQALSVSDPNTIVNELHTADRSQFKSFEISFWNHVSFLDIRIERKAEKEVEIPGTSGRMQTVTVRDFQSTMLAVGFQFIGTGVEDFTVGLETPVLVDEEIVASWEMFGPTYSVDFNRTPRHPFKRTALLDRIVTDFENNEPLELLMSWPLIESAKQKGMSLVALMPDSIINAVAMSKVKESTLLAPILTEMGRKLSFEFDEDLGYWSVTPGDPVAARDRRSDRPALGKFFRSLDKTGWVSLENYSQLRKETGVLVYTHGWDQLQTIAMSTQDHELPPFSSMDVATRLYTMLNTLQKSAAREQWVAVPYDQWPGWVKQVLSNEGWTLERFYTAADPRKFPGLADAGAYMDLVSQGGLGNGRKLAAVVGGSIPQNATLSFRVTDPFWVHTLKSDGSWLMLPHDSVGTIFADLEKPDSRLQKFYDINKLALGLKDRLDVVLTVPGSGSIQISGEFWRHPRLGEYAVPGSIPAELKRRIESEIQKANRGGH